MLRNVLTSFGRFGFHSYAAHLCEKSENDQSLDHWNALFILSLLTAWCFQRADVHHSTTTAALHWQVSVWAAGCGATTVQRESALFGVCGFLLGLCLTTSRYWNPALPPIAQQILNKKRRPFLWSGSPVVRRSVLHPFFDITELLRK